MEFIPHRCRAYGAERRGVCSVCVSRILCDLCVLLWLKGFRVVRGLFLKQGSRVQGKHRTSNGGTFNIQHSTLNFEEGGESFKIQVSSRNSVHPVNPVKNPGILNTELRTSNGNQMGRCGNNALPGMEKGFKGKMDCFMPVIVRTSNPFLRAVSVTAPVWRV